MPVNLGKFVHTQTGKYIMSILLGLGLASLFRTVCKGKDCLIFHAPPLDQFKDKIPDPLIPHPVPPKLAEA